MIDFHCHLDLYSDAAGIVDECRRRGLYVLSVTTTPSAWNGTTALASGAPRIRTALGLHPEIAHERQGELPLFDELLPKTRYVGEIGLDGGPELRAHCRAQIAVFEHILQKCAAAGGRIMTLHSRRAVTPVLDRLERFQDAGTPVLHWFSGTLKELDRAVRLGCWFSVGPAMLRGAKGRMLIARMPSDRVLTESDGPFAQNGDAPLKPWDVESAVRSLAQLWAWPDAKTTQLLTDNLRRLVGAANPAQDHIGP